MKKYDFRKIEPKWQKKWLKDKLYFAKDESGKEKKYVLVEFPYPSGEGLHMGHLRPYVAGDVLSRLYRMKGFETLFPMGWDAFGLPAENFAIKHGVQPEVSTAKNIANAKRQMLSWGLSFDWGREVNTTDPDYYKWTQWIFLEFFKAGLAYEATGLINWCPKDKTGLANEEVINGKCDRCGTEVEKKELRQWYLKITAYAEKLLEGLKDLPEWPEAVKTQQENWIGRSEGASVTFDLTGGPISNLEVFTTRPDTIFGATFLVVSPELAKKWLDEGWKAEWNVVSYVKDALAKREEESKEKTGVFSGLRAMNPATRESIPVWISDYVLAGYGTGAIMAVPAHDERDFEFAKKFDLPIKKVIEGGEDGELYDGNGKLLDSGKFTDMDSLEAKWEIAKVVGGKKKVQYRLRDWVFSRQRYWGEPIPLIHCEKCGVVPVPVKDLPVKLPKVKKYEPTGTGESPLADIESFVSTKCPECKGKARRETNTMPQWAGSSWYWLRYADPKNKKEFSSLEKQKIWTPVDVYLGGMEHTTLHLLYSRFWNIFLHDRGLTAFKEPYVARKPHGIILAADGEKMSKSRGNVVNPDAIVEQFGADTLRMYELFLGPHETTVSWNDKGIMGVARFLERVWKFVHAEHRETAEELPILHRTIKKVGEDIESLRYNTAVSALMILMNELEGAGATKEQKGILLKLVAPFAPHIAEELWHELNSRAGSIHTEKWPEYDPELCAEKTINLVVQVNGKVRSAIAVPAGITEEQAKELAMSDEKVLLALRGAEPKRMIYVPGRLINIVI